MESNRMGYQYLVSNLFSAQTDSSIYWKFEFLFHEDSQYTGV